MKKISILAFLILFLATQVLAAGLVPCGGTGEPACTLCHFFEMAKNIIDKFISVVPAIALLFVVIAGAYFILGSGYDPRLIINAKAILWSITVGLLIIYGSWLAVNLFLNVIGVVEWTGLDSGWWQINCPIPIE